MEEGVRIAGSKNFQDLPSSPSCVSSGDVRVCAEGHRAGSLGGRVREGIRIIYLLPDFPPKNSVLVYGVWMATSGDIQRLILPNNKISTLINPTVFLFGLQQDG